MTQVTQVIYNGVVAASKMDAALTDLIGTDQYPNALTQLHLELRDALLMIPPTLGVIDAAPFGLFGCRCPGPDTCAGPPCASA